MLAEAYIKKGRTMRFYEDRVEFNGKSLLYDDIEAVSMAGMPTKLLIGAIPVGESFNGDIQFWVRGGKRHHVKLLAYSFFGTSGAKKKRMAFIQLFDPFYNIVARKLAERLVAVVRSGGAIEVAGLAINSTEATHTAKLTKKHVSINRVNYGSTYYSDAGTLEVMDKNNEQLWRYLPMAFAKNAILVPHILDALYL
jgi:hypothetical protein